MSSAPVNAPRSILVVDDEPALRETISLTLEQAGHRTATAANGKEGAQLLAREGFDLVITDMLMPGGDGLEFITEIHRRHPQLRILAMTGGGRISSEHYLKMARALGAHGALEKPFSQQELLTAVGTALDSTGTAASR